jgi:hypothetical protein
MDRKKKILNCAIPSIFLIQSALNTLMKQFLSLISVQNLRNLPLFKGTASYIHITIFPAFWWRYPEDGGSIFIRNIGSHQLNYRLLHPRRPNVSLGREHTIVQFVLLQNENRWTRYWKNISLKWIRQRQPEMKEDGEKNKMKSNSCRKLVIMWYRWRGHAVALCYKPQGRRFNSQCGHCFCFFQFT